MLAATCLLQSRLAGSPEKYFTTPMQISRCFLIASAVSKIVIEFFNVRYKKSDPRRDEASEDPRFVSTELVYVRGLLLFKDGIEASHNEHYMYVVLD
mgnify:FL=1